MADSWQCSLSSINSHSFVKSNIDLAMLAYGGQNLKLVCECDRTKKKDDQKYHFAPGPTSQNAGYPIITPCGRENNICSIGQNIARLHRKMANHKDSQKPDTEPHFVPDESIPRPHKEFL
jgi:hypothetical protein